MTSFCLVHRSSAFDKKFNQWTVRGWLNHQSETSTVHCMGVGWGNVQYNHYLSHLLNRRLLHQQQQQQQQQLTDDCCQHRKNNGRRRHRRCCRRWEVTSSSHHLHLLLQWIDAPLLLLLLLPLHFERRLLVVWCNPVQMQLTMMTLKLRWLVLFLILNSHHFTNTNKKKWKEKSKKTHGPWRREQCEIIGNSLLWCWQWRIHRVSELMVITWMKRGFVQSDYGTVRLA